MPIGSIFSFARHAETANCWRTVAYMAAGKGFTMSTATKSSARESANADRPLSARSWSEVLAWLLAVGALPRAIHRVLLYSREPGTGKSSWATKALGDERVERVQCHPQMQPEDLLYGSIGLENGTTKNQPGSALRALRGGKCLLLEEVGDVSPDIVPILHSLLDDREIAGVTVPETGERVRPADGYMVIGTTNNDPSTFTEALLSRFDLVLLCNRPSDGIIERLKSGRIPGLAEMLANQYADSARAATRWTPALDTRGAIRLDSLAGYMTPEQAAELIFGPTGVDIIAGCASAYVA